VFLHCSGQGMVSPHLGAFGVVGRVIMLFSTVTRIVLCRGLIVNARLHICISVYSHDRGAVTIAS
jgi:hypothetical protein